MNIYIVSIFTCTAIDLYIMYMCRFLYKYTYNVRRADAKMEIWFEMEEIALKASLDKLGVPPLIEVHVGFPLYKVGTEPLRQN